MLHIVRVMGPDLVLWSASCKTEIQKTCFTEVAADRFPKRIFGITGNVVFGIPGRTPRSVGLGRPNDLVDRAGFEIDCISQGSLPSGIECNAIFGAGDSPGGPLYGKNPFVFPSGP